MFAVIGMGLMPTTKKIIVATATMTGTMTEVFTIKDTITMMGLLVLADLLDLREQAEVTTPDMSRFASVSA